MAYKHPNRHPAQLSGINKTTGSVVVTLEYLDKMVTQFENLQWFLEKMLGGSSSSAVVVAFNGVNGVNAGKVSATSVASMAVDINAGAFFVDKVPFKLLSNATTPALTAPTGSDRIDVVAASAVDGSFVILQGIEGSTPVAPSLTEGMVGLAEIYLRPGMTVINDEDTTAADEGYITDTRIMLNA